MMEGLLTSTLEAVLAKADISTIVLTVCLLLSLWMNIRQYRVNSKFMDQILQRLDRLER